jgi:hypothetical protein
MKQGSFVAALVLAGLAATAAAARAPQQKTQEPSHGRNVPPAINPPLHQSML